MRASRVALRLPAQSFLSRQMSAAVRSTAASGSTVYESQRAVDEYLQMHFGKLEEVCPYGFGPKDALDFPDRCADVVASAVRTSAPVQKKARTEGGSALDVGCAVGGQSFALARHFAKVDGVDFSNAFVQAAQTMKNDGSMKYTSLVEGTRVAERVALAPSGGVREKCNFFQGDACNLETLRSQGSLQAGGYDAVFAGNLLCRLPKPRAFLKSCSEWVVNKGGVLVLVSPFSWLEEYTPREEWIGGGEAISSEVLEKEMLSLGFALRERTDVPFLIREHARKFQWGVSECSVWDKAE